MSAASPAAVELAAAWEHADEGYWKETGALGGGGYVRVFTH